MSLPPQDIDWRRARARALEGPAHRLAARSGLRLAGRAAKCARRSRAAARRFRAAGATVEPMRPFLTREMLDGIDHFWRMRALARHLAPAAGATRQGAALHRRIGRCRRRRFSGEKIFKASARSWRRARRRSRPAQPYDFVLSPVVAGRAPSRPSLPCPTNDPAATARRTSPSRCPSTCRSSRRRRSIAATPTSGLPIGLQIAGRRFDDLGVLQTCRWYRGSARAAKALAEAAGKLSRA